MPARGGAGIRARMTVGPSGRGAIHRPRILPAKSIMSETLFAGFPFSAVPDKRQAPPAHGFFSGHSRPRRCAQRHRRRTHRVGAVAHGIRTVAHSIGAVAHGIRTVAHGVYAVAHGIGLDAHKGGADARMRIGPRKYESGSAGSSGTPFEW